MNRFLRKIWSFFDLQALALLGLTALLVAKPVPYSNEFSYLPRIKGVYSSTYLASDITFSTSTNEYWLFDHLFGLFTYLFSLHTIAWCGRILCWIITFHALRKLGKRWDIPSWLITISIAIWLLFNQAAIADEWVIGTFEAKCVAYILLIYGLDRICAGRDILSGILLGLSFAFHPLIGMWGILAAVPAQFIAKRNIISSVRITSISGIFSLIGLIPLLIMRSESTLPSEESLAYYLLVRFPFHCDPFSWSRSEMLFPFLILATSITIYFYSKRTLAMTFLTLFLSILGVFYILGIVARYFEAFEILKYMPMRVFSVIVLLFFVLNVSRSFYFKLYKKPLILGLIIASCVGLLWTKMVFRPLEQIGTTIQLWRSEPDDYLKMYKWVEKNTPQNAVIIAPPWREEFWYISQRAMVVNYNKAIDADINEWVKRVYEFVGKTELSEGVREDSDLAAYYEKRSIKDTIESAKRYQSDLIITEAVYPFEIVHQEGNLKIYRIPKEATLKTNSE